MPRRSKDQIWGRDLDFAFLLESRGDGGLVPWHVKAHMPALMVGRAEELDVDRHKGARRGQAGQSYPSSRSLSPLS